MKWKPSQKVMQTDAYNDSLFYYLTIYYLTIAMQQKRL